MGSGPRQIVGCSKVASQGGSRCALAILAVVVLGTLSCEQAITLKGTVTVPISVQQRFSATARGRLVIQATRAANGASIGGETIYMLCEPTSADLVLPYALSKFACAEETYVEAMVIPMSTDPRADAFAGLPCGKVSASIAGASQTVAIAYGRKLVFEGRNGGSCSATAGADITVDLVE